MRDPAVARDGYKVFKEGRAIGHVTSGSFAPSVDANIGMAYVAAGNEALGNTLEIEIHGRRASAEVVKRPFVALKHKKN
jgi:aminomethyltransferase